MRNPSITGTAGLHEIRDRPIDRLFEKISKPIIWRHIWRARFYHNAHAKMIWHNFSNDKFATETRQLENEFINKKRTPERCPFK